jgi:hypothetical protein
MKKSYKILAGKPERRRPVGGSRSTWEDNTGMHLREIGLEM